MRKSISREVYAANVERVWHEYAGTPALRDSILATIEATFAPDGSWAAGDSAVGAASTRGRDSASEPTAAHLEAKEYAASQRLYRLDTGAATESDLETLSLADLRTYLTANFRGAIRGTPEAVEDDRTTEQMVADLAAAKALAAAERDENRVDADRSARNAAQRRADAAWADRESDRKRELMGQGIPADTAAGMAAQQVAAQRVAVEGQPISGVQQARNDVSNAYDAVNKQQEG